MKNIKAKIERVEKETKRIEAINKLITYCEDSHLKPVATFVNGGQVGRIDDVVIIDKSIMVQMLAEQILTIELEIEEDVQFIAAVELLASKGIVENIAAQPLQSPAAAPAPMPAHAPVMR